MLRRAVGGTEGAEKNVEERSALCLANLGQDDLERRTDSDEDSLALERDVLDGELGGERHCVVDGKEVGLWRREGGVAVGERG